MLAPDLLVAVPAAPGYSVQRWSIDRPLDALEFRREFLPHARVDELLAAHGSVNADRFHGWAAGSLVLVVRSAQQTDRTIQTEPTYHVTTWVRIVCLAGMADKAVDCRGNVVADHILARLPFGDLPLGRLINPSPRVHDANR